VEGHGPSVVVRDDAFPGRRAARFRTPGPDDHAEQTVGAVDGGRALD
jgi:hypothetical protein